MPICKKCSRELNEGQFYTHRDGSKTRFCKKCMTMHIDVMRPDTFLWALEEMDVPYIPSEWKILVDRAFAKNPNKMDSVFGKYVSKMKLTQFNKYRWADSEKLMADAEAKALQDAREREAADEQLRKEYEAGEISEAAYKTLTSTESQATYMQMPQQGIEYRNNPFNENIFMSEEEVTPEAELTQEDKLYLAMKWGRLYKPHEWIELEKKYEEMMNSFDIQDSDTTGTLILICKTYLKMNQAIDQGDMDGFQKLSRVYDSLRKSAKFTAAQNKENKSDYVDSVGELVAMCEKEGFIPRFATDIPQDKVDKTLKDMNNYLYKLVTQDLGFGQQIEDSLKKIQIQKEMNDAEIILDDEGPVLENEDYEDYYENIQEQIEKDIKSVMGEEDF